VKSRKETLARIQMMMMMIHQNCQRKCLTLLTT